MDFLRQQRNRCPNCWNNCLCSTCRGHSSYTGCCSMKSRPWVPAPRSCCRNPTPLGNMSPVMATSLPPFVPGHSGRRICKVFQVRRVWSSCQMAAWPFAVSQIIFFCKMCIVLLKAFRPALRGGTGWTLWNAEVSRHGNGTKSLERRRIVIFICLSLGVEGLVKRMSIYSWRMLPFGPDDHTSCSAIFVFVAASSCGFPQCYSQVPWRSKFSIPYCNLLLV